MSTYAVTDMYTGRTINYPDLNDTTRTLPFDFHFTKNGAWFYINSVKDAKHPLLKKQMQTVKERGEKWRLVDSRSGKPIRSSR